MTFPVVAAVNGGNQGFSNNPTVNLPAGIGAGDLLLVFFATDDATITFPVGWTQLFQTYYGNWPRFGAWYRIADGGEGATITVTLSLSKKSAHTSYRITGYSGTPEVGTPATGQDTTPNPPSLSPSWGAQDTLWFACEGNSNGMVTVSSYPTNYANGRQDRKADSESVGTSSARRELNAASENPGTFTISGLEYWIANTVAIQPAPPPGWTGKISGVTNPAKVMGVDKTSINKVKGVASA